MAFLPAAADAAACASPYASTLSVKCTAQNGYTEEQYPKDKSLATYAAPDTDCMAIQTPVEGHWRECLRTVQYDFEWKYDGEDDAVLKSVNRDITNSLGVYPEETVPLVKSYWGKDIWIGVGLKDTYHQIVVDLCLEPITYTYKLLVDIEMPGGSKCTDEAEYIYAITANYGETQGYTAFKPQSAEEEDSAPEVLAPSSEGIEGLDDPTSSAYFSGSLLKGGFAAASLVVASLFV